MNRYFELSHKFLKMQMIERFAFEMEVKEKKIPLDILKNDCANNEVYSNEEYKYMYKESLKLLKETSIIRKYKL